MQVNVAAAAQASRYGTLSSLMSSTFHPAHMVATVMPVKTSRELCQSRDNAHMVACRLITMAENKTKADGTIHRSPYRLDPLLVLSKP